MEVFYHEYSFLAHGNTTITAGYTNRVSKVEDYINKIELILEMEDPYKIVGLDIEYTYEPETTQKAALIQLCMGTDCLLYQICSADQPCPKLSEFLGMPDIIFAGIDISNDITRLGHCKLSVANFVDIQKRWKPVDSINTKDSLADYAAAIIDSQYKSIKEKLTRDEHKLWQEVPLSMKHIWYASIDAYATYEVYRRIVNFEKGQQKLAEFQESSSSSSNNNNNNNKISKVQAVEAEEEDH